MKNKKKNLKTRNKNYASEQYELGMDYYYGRGKIRNIQKSEKFFKEAAKRGHKDAQYELGLIYYNADDMDEAVKLFEKATKQGHKEAKMILSVCYLNGYGVEKKTERGLELLKEYTEKNNKELVEYLKKANEKGNMEAKVNLAVCYENGIGTQINIDRAVELYKEGAEKGHPVAQVNLGICYYNGLGVKIDIEKAVELYKKSAEQGNYLGKFNLADCYYYGVVIEKDIEKAIKLYKEVVEQGNPETEFTLGLIYYRGDEVEKNLEEAVKLFKKSSDKGYVNAKLALGICYYNGEGINQDYEKAAKLFEYVLENGNIEEKVDLGICYYNGVGSEKNIEKAAKLFKEAAEQGNLKAQLILSLYYYYDKQDFASFVKWAEEVLKQEKEISQYVKEEIYYYLIAQCYFYGKGVKQDLKKSIIWFERSSEQHYADAQLYLGVCYENGIGTDKNIEKAIKYYKEASKQEEPIAQCILGTYYCKGDILERNLKKGIEYLEKSAEQGNIKAQIYLSYCYALGEGVDRNIEKAIELLNKVALEENKDDEIDLKDLNYTKDIKEIIHAIRSKEKKIDLLEKENEKLRNENSILNKINNIKLDAIYDFFENELPKYLEKERNKLLHEKGENNIQIEDFIKINEYINNNILNSNDRIVKFAEDRLRVIFKEKWDFLLEESKKSLISADVMWQKFKKLPDFSGIGICITNALEGELKKYFFEDYKEYLTKEYGELNRDNWPTTMYNEKNHRLKYIEFTMGTLPYIFCEKLNIKNSRNEEQKNKDKECLAKYLEIILKDEYKEDREKIFTESNSDEISFIDRCEIVRDNCRNISAHPGIATKEQVENCYVEVIGKNRENEKNSILLNLLEVIKQS